MRNSLLYAIILLLISFCACVPESQFEGYAVTDTGIHFKLLKIGEEDNWVFNPGDYYTADILYSTMDDSVFFEGRRKVQIYKPEFDGCIEECFSMLQKGDSATFIISADKFFRKTLESDLPSFFPPNSNMKVDLSIIDIQTEKQYNKEREAFLTWIRDFEEYEDVALSQFLEDESVGVRPSNSGMYKVNVREGNGTKISYGDTITIHYEGWFLNGTFFDSTRKRNQPFSFVYGTEWQVVKGLEEALGKMEEGEKSVFIMPSKLAFGYTGSSTGIIPPFTSVIFEVEVLDVIKRDTVSLTN